MFCVLRKEHLALALGALVFFVLFIFILWRGAAQPALETSMFLAEDGSLTIIIDPGHGGEDGGAVAADGTVESQINLEVAQRLQEILVFLGREPVMTRDSDISIYSEGASTLREKKVSDIRNRVELVNSYPSAILLSIHQNSLPQAKSVHGAQAFCNQAEGGEALAAVIQDRLNQAVNLGNEKDAKVIDSSVYLMSHIQCAGVLVECGFLSNAEETALLKTGEHQTLLAISVAAGLLSGITANVSAGTPSPG